MTPLNNWKETPLAGAEQVVQHGEQPGPEQLHVPRAQPGDAVAVLQKLSGVLLKAQLIRALALGEGGKLPQIGEIFLLIWLHDASPPARVRSV